ncbi:MAG: PKD-like domain-containing protein, partial [Daejeonella sp.]
MNTIFRIVICCLVISYSGATELFAQCGPNTLAFNGSQPIFNTACGNNSYQVINGSTPSGTGNTYRWEVSFSAATYTTIVNGSNVPVSSQDLSKSEITNFVLAPAGNASGDYRIRRIVTNTSASCTNTSEPVSLYYALSSSATTGGTIIGETLVCSPATGTLTVAGNTGPILRWESAPSSSGPWTPIPNSATRSYSYSGITSGTCYRALSDNICDGTAGSIDALDKYSSVICITVNSVPTITQQPLSQGACLGSGISLSVTATSATTISYQWRKNGFDINGANAATFSIASAVNSDAGSYDVVMTNSCGSVTSSAAVVTVNPVPVATVPPNSVVCPGTVIPITTFSSSPTGASFTWTNSNTAIGLAASGSGDLPSFTAANGTTSAITATITVTPVLNGCAGPASNYTITVNPTAVVTVPADFSVCEGATISATNFSSTPVGVTYTWTNSNTAIGLSAGSGSGNVPSFTALSSGSTTITVTPYVNGCAGTPSSYVIAVNQLPVVSASATDETSCSANNGTITITASGDATLEYSINGGLTYPSTVGNFTGLSPGSYAVMVRSSSTGCVVAGPILTVSSPNAPPKPVIDSSNSPVCEGETITVSVQTPIPNATYTWTGPGGYFLSEPTGTITRPNATIAMSGNYVVTVSVAGCVSDAEPFSIVVNRRPVVNQPPNLTYCAGASVPVSSFITTPAGATYSWTNTDPSIGLAVAGSGQISPFTAINNTNSPITATITVTPSLNNCDGVPVDFTITINPLPVIDPVANIIACHEATIPQQVFTSNIVDATFSWTISGLGASYSGSGSIPSFTAVNNGVSPIVGTVTVTANVNSCSGSSEVYTITVNPLPRLTNAPLNQTTCSGTSTTEVVLTSDVANADFSWTAVSSSTDIAGFTPNGIGNIPEELINNSGTVQGTVTYTIFATANGCTGPATSYVTRVNPLPRLRTTIPLSQTICSGSSSTAVNLSSETAGTSFTWTATASSGLVIGFDPSGSGDILPQTILNTGTSQGTVTYTITPNTSNCTGPISTYTITINPLPTATISGSATVCYGADAVLNVALTGTAPWSITYSDGISSFTSTGITTNSYSFNVSATSTKTYTIVSVTDALCSNSGAGSATISQPSAPLTATASSINVNCFGIYDGSITFTGVSGGSGSYEYSINGGVNWETGSSFAGLAPSTYSLQIRDLTDPACILVVNSALVITQPAAALTAGIASQTNVLCFGASTGSVNTSVSGGTAPYTYLWSNGSATANLSNVPAGTYTLNITDANGCAIGIVLSVTITQPGSALNAGLSSANVTCFGGSDGSITITNVSGGSGSYEYSINGGSGWQSGVVFNNLTAGTYQVLIRDASAPACMFTVNASLTISQPPQLNAAVTSNNVNCFGISDGSITFTGVSGGSGSYEYSINSGVNWQTGSSFAGLAPSTYSLQIRDLANPACRLILNSALVITQPSAPLSATISSQVNILCFGASTGSVNLAVTGGTAPYTYLWSNGFTSSNLTNVPAGSYTVNISDAQGCSLGT